MTRGWSDNESKIKGIFCSPVADDELVIERAEFSPRNFMLSMVMVGLAVRVSEVVVGVGTCRVLSVIRASRHKTQPANA